LPAKFPPAPASLLTTPPSGVVNDLHLHLNSIAHRPPREDIQHFNHVPTAAAANRPLCLNVTLPGSRMFRPRLASAAAATASYSSTAPAASVGRMSFSTAGAERVPVQANAERVPLGLLRGPMVSSPMPPINNINTTPSSSSLLFASPQSLRMMTMNTLNTAAAAPPAAPCTGETVRPVEEASSSEEQPSASSALMISAHNPSRDIVIRETSGVLGENRLFWPLSSSKGAVLPRDGAEDDVPPADLDEGGGLQKPNSRLPDKSQTACPGGPSPVSSAAVVVGRNHGNETREAQQMQQQQHPSVSSVEQTPTPTPTVNLPAQGESPTDAGAATVNLPAKGESPPLPNVHQHVHVPSTTMMLPNTSTERSGPPTMKAHQYAAPSQLPALALGAAQTMGSSSSKAPPLGSSSSSSIYETKQQTTPTAAADKEGKTKIIHATPEYFAHQKLLHAQYISQLEQRHIVHTQALAHTQADQAQLAQQRIQEHAKQLEQQKQAHQQALWHQQQQQQQYQAQVQHQMHQRQIMETQVPQHFGQHPSHHQQQLVPGPHPGAPLPAPLLSHHNLSAPLPTRTPVPPPYYPPYSPPYDESSLYRHISSPLPSPTPTSCMNSRLPVPHAGERSSSSTHRLPHADLGDPPPHLSAAGIVGERISAGTQHTLGLWAYDKPQLVSLHLMYLSDLPPQEGWLSSTEYVSSVHSGEQLVASRAPPRLLPTFDAKELTTLPVVTKPAKVVGSDSVDTVSRENALQTQVFTHLSDLRMSKKCVAEDGQKCFFDEKFLISLPKFEDYMVVNIWRLQTTYLTAHKEYTMYGQIYLPLNDPQWNKKVCTWPLVDPLDTVQDVQGNATILFSLASTPEKCQQLTVESVRDRSVSLSWKEPASDNGSPIKGYKIQYRVVMDRPMQRPIRRAYGDSQGKPQIGDELEWQTACDSLKDTKYTVEHLPGNTKFMFRVLTANRVGYGEPAESRIVLTGPCAPSAPGNPRIIGRSPDGTSQVFLEWDAPNSNGAKITGHKLWAKSACISQGKRVASSRWVDIGEIDTPPVTVASELDPSGEKLVYRAKITSLPMSGRMLVGVAGINSAGVGPVCEEDDSLAFDWQGEVWETDNSSEGLAESIAGEPECGLFQDATNRSGPTRRDRGRGGGFPPRSPPSGGEGGISPSLSLNGPGTNAREDARLSAGGARNQSEDAHGTPEQSPTQIREEQENDYQVSLLHDEVKALENEEAELNAKIKRLQDEIDEQESLAKMARQRMSAYGADNPNISKALDDAMAVVQKLQSESDEVVKQAGAITAEILDKRAILQALED